MSLRTAVTDRRPSVARHLRTLVAIDAVKRHSAARRNDERRT